MQMLLCVAGVHKKMLAVVVGRVGAQTIEVVRSEVQQHDQRPEGVGGLARSARRQRSSLWSPLANTTSQCGCS